MYDSDFTGAQIDAILKGANVQIEESGTSVSKQLYADVIYRFGTMTSLTVTLNEPLMPAIPSLGSSMPCRYGFTFTSGSTATTLSMPSTIYWPDGAPTIEANTHYEVNIDYDPKSQKYFGAFLAHPLT